MGGIRAERLSLECEGKAGRFRSPDTAAEAKIQSRVHLPSRRRFTPASAMQSTIGDVALISAPPAKSDARVHISPDGRG